MNEFVNQCLALQRQSEGKTFRFIKQFDVYVDDLHTGRVTVNPGAECKLTTEWGITDNPVRVYFLNTKNTLPVAASNILLREFFNYVEEIKDRCSSNQIDAFRKTDNEYECFHSPVMYSADGCNNCKNQQSCYQVWLKYMNN